MYHRRNYTWRVLHSLCRIDGDVSDANTTVCGMGMPLFQLFFLLFLELRQVTENMEGAIKKKCGKFTQYSVGQVHDPLLFFVTPVKSLSILLGHFHSLYSSRHFLKR